MIAASCLDYQLRTRAYKNQGFKVSIEFMEGTLFLRTWISTSHLKSGTSIPIPPPLLSSSVSSPIGSVYSILRPCLPRCVPHSLTQLRTQMAWAFFGHLSSQSYSALLPMVQFWCLSCSALFHRRSLRSFTPCCRFPTASQPNSLFIHLA